jgi:hypothetical protein
MMSLIVIRVEVGWREACFWVMTQVEWVVLYPDESYSRNGRCHQHSNTPRRRQALEYDLVSPSLFV